MKEYKLHRDNIAPYGADKIGVFDDKDNLVGIIPIDKIKKEYGTRLYRVGLLSDTHYKDTDGMAGPYLVDCGGESDLENALDFFIQKESLQNGGMICIAGDITSNDKEHEYSFNEKYNSINNNYSCNIPFYTCKGNHDVAASYDEELNEIWKNSGVSNEVVITSTSDPNIWTFTEKEEKEKNKLIYFGEHSSFYFLKDNDVYIFLNLDYGGNYATSAYKTLTDNDGYQYYQYYNPEDIESFQGILNKYRNKRCFIFTHYFFSQKSGNPSFDYSYESDTDKLYNDIKHNDHYRTYCLSGLQFALLNEMNNHYKNSIWFSGHSHYIWKCQEESMRANVCNWDSFKDEYVISNGKYKKSETTGKITKTLKEVEDTIKVDTSRDNQDVVWFFNDSGELLNIFYSGAGSGILFSGLSEYNYVEISDVKVELGRIKIDNEEYNGLLTDIPKESLNDVSLVFEGDEITDSLKEKEESGENIGIGIHNGSTSRYTLNSNYATTRNDSPHISISSTDFIDEYKQRLENGEYIHIEIDATLSNSKDNVVVNKNYNILQEDFSILNHSVQKGDNEEYDSSYLESAYNIHLPSSARPLKMARLTGDPYDIQDPGSDFGIMDVYEDYVDIRGINGITEEQQEGNYVNHYIPYAHYRLNVGGNNLKNIETKDYNYFLEKARSHKEAK